jgi:hypothetical protein
MLDANPDFLWVERKWIYRPERKTKIKMANTREMYTEMATIPVYLVYIQPMASKRHAGVPPYRTQANVISMPRAYADDTDVFSEEGAASLPSHACV